MRPVVMLLAVGMLLAGCGDAAPNNGALEEENAALRAEVADLREQIAALDDGDDAAVTTTSASPATTSSAAATTTAPTTTQPSSPAPTIELLWFGVDPEFDTVRFVAEITNPGVEPISGLVSEWTAFDQDEVIVGNFRSQRPVIPANGSHLYVGGAGSLNLTGTPARVSVAIAEPGRFTPGAIDPQLDVSGIEVSDESGDTLVVTAVAVEPDREIRSADVITAVILRDDTGTVTDAEFIGDVFAPETIPAGQAFRVEFRVTRPATPPASVDVLVWASA